MGTYVTLGTPIAVTAHATLEFPFIKLRVATYNYETGGEEVNLYDFVVTQVGSTLWEGRLTWRPEKATRYSLSAFSSREYSPPISITVVETHSGTFPTPVAVTPKSLTTFTPLPSVLVPTPQVNFWADSLQVMSGHCTVLHWDVENATGVYLDEIPVNPKDGQKVCPKGTSNYILHVESAAGVIDKTVTVETIQPTFTAVPTLTLPPTVIPTFILPPATKIPSPIPTLDISGPRITDLSHSPDKIYDIPSCPPNNTVINAKVSDPSGVSMVMLHYRVVKEGNSGVWKKLNMTSTSSGIYQRTLGREELLASLSGYYAPAWIEYYVEALDSRGNTSISSTQTIVIQLCLL